MRVTGVASRVGTAFGKYKITSLLGKGGMGEVYQAYDTVKHRNVALKILAEQFSKDQRFRTRFRRESHAAAILQEPHVIPIHDWGEIDGSLYIDMRLVQGQTLHELLSRGPLEPARAVSITNQIAEALDAAHAEGLIHRDVKAQNIIVTSTDFAYLVDFGIAEVQGETRLTTAGTRVGSFAYMAPERFRDQDLTPAVDVYALACVLYEALTGDDPFPADSVEQLIGAHISSPPPRPSDVNPRVPPSFDEVIARGMAKQPHHRYRSAGELGRAAQRALQADWRMSTQADTIVGHQSVPPPVRPPPMRPAPMRAPSVPPVGPTVLPPTHAPREPSRRWVLPTVIAVAAALILSAVGVIVVLLARPDSAHDASTSPTTASHSPTTTHRPPAPSQGQPPPSPAPTTPASLTGKWSGRVTGDQSLNLVADIVDGPPLTATVNYPDANCTCTWTQHGSADNGVRFVTEKVTSGSCAPSEVTLTPQNDGSLYFTSTYYSESQHRNFNIHGTLTRSNG